MDLIFHFVSKQALYDSFSLGVQITNFFFVYRFHCNDTLIFYMTSKIVCDNKKIEFVILLFK